MKILLFGKHGQIGWELQRALAPLGECIAPDRRSTDFTDLEALRACIRAHRPALIVNAAAYTAVDAAETERKAAHRINADAPRVLAQEAEQLGAWLVHYSTDYIFDGEKTTPYGEQDRPNPLSAYGESKLAGEEHVRAECARHLILRTGWVYSTRGRNFPTTILRLARERAHLRVVSDQFGTPTHAELCADLTALALQRVLGAVDGESLAGTYHVAAGGMTDWYSYARHILAQAREQGIALKASAETVEAIPAVEYAAAARRPRNSCLDTSHFRQCFQLHLPDWRLQVERMVAEIAEREQP